MKNKVKANSNFNGIDEFDWVLIQTQEKDVPSVPQLVMILGFDMLDMALSIKSYPYQNRKREHYVALSENETDIRYDIWWGNYVHIVGHWKQKPAAQEVLKAYREYAAKSGDQLYSTLD